MALAVLMGYVEAIIPVQMPMPGMKLGLPNLVIAAILYLYSWKEAVIISALRVIVIGFLFGNMFSIIICGSNKRSGFCFSNFFTKN